MRNTKTILKRISIACAVIIFIYLVLLIPVNDDSDLPAVSSPHTKQPFAWNQDEYWEALEATFLEQRESECSKADVTIQSDIGKANALLRQMEKMHLAPDAEEFGELERLLFEIGPLVGSCKAYFQEYTQLATDMRNVIKKQSEHWDMNSDTARRTIYRLLYGSRAAVEEIILQMPPGLVPALTVSRGEPSSSPWVDIRGLRIHSGDILVSRGGAPTSALIARGSDYPGNFSHIALVYINPDTGKAHIIESVIEKGVKVSTVDEYLKDKKFRVMVLRLKADHARLSDDPLIPHKAAEYALKAALSKHIPYDFEMNFKDSSKLFCSEVVSSAYSQYGINLWMGISHISSPGLRKWLGSLGVRYFETQEPSDLEYDPQLVIVAEWRDPQTLRKDHLDNAATEVMLEGAEKGDELRYAWYFLPIARIAKAFSAVVNIFGMTGPIPEGMSATAALRTQNYMEKHDAIVERLMLKAEEFKTQYGYEPPYWQLVNLSRVAKAELEK